MRFDTTVGSFDLVLNPTGDPRLQGHVDNLLHYVVSGRYDGTVINRADEGFVLQVGSFRAASPEVPATVEGFIPIEPFDPVDGESAAELGLSNTYGMVGLALPTNGLGGYNQDGGTSSFFINLARNTFLDADYTVFAQIADMTTIETIMALPQIDLAAIPAFGASLGNLAFTDVPLSPDGQLILISRAFVVPEPTIGTLFVLALVGCYTSRTSRRRK